MKVLLDMDMSPRLGNDVDGRGDGDGGLVGLRAANEPDPKIMAYALAHAYVVLTNDLDFGLLLSATNAFAPSVVRVRLDNLDPELIGGRIIEVLREFSVELVAGALVTVDTKKTRVRVLPLGPRERWVAGWREAIQSVRLRSGLRFASLRSPTPQDK